MFNAIIIWHSALYCIRLRFCCRVCLSLSLRLGRWWGWRWRWRRWLARILSVGWRITRASWSILVIYTTCVWWRRKSDIWHLEIKIYRFTSIIISCELLIRIKTIYWTFKTEINYIWLWHDVVRWVKQSSVLLLQFYLKLWNIHVVAIISIMIFDNFW